MDTVAGKSVTVTLSNQYYSGYRPIANVGDLIKVRGYKRLRLIVTGWQQEKGYGTISTKKAYQPSPKSKLNRKGVFSKMKLKIIPLMQSNIPSTQ